MNDALKLENVQVADVRDFLDWAPTRNRYRCHVCLTRDEDGTFSAIVLNLPGCGSCGVTEEEALDNVREAVLGVVASHVAAGEEIPWVDSTQSEIPQGSHQRWIVVNA
jgi:predicted RNase H-like HicB family nuclease